MASETTIMAINGRIKELENTRAKTKEWMESRRRESIRNYRDYKIAKEDYIYLGRFIKELKDDLRRIKNGKEERDVRGCDC